MPAVSHPAPASQRDELAVVLRVLQPVLDIIDTPVETPIPPAWCAERGWSEFLLKLSDSRNIVVPQKITFYKLLIGLLIRVVGELF